jgi:hypothetical protein
MQPVRRYHEVSVYRHMRLQQVPSHEVRVSAVWRSRMGVALDGRAKVVFSIRPWQLYRVFAAARGLKTTKDRSGSGTGSGAAPHLFQGAAVFHCYSRPHARSSTELLREQLDELVRILCYFST